MDQNSEIVIGKRRDWKKQQKKLNDEAKGTAFPATIDTLRKIVKDKQNQVVMFKSGQGNS